MTVRLGKVSLGVVLALLGALVAAGPASAQSITGASATKNAGNSPDNFQDGTFTSFQRTTNANVLSNNGFVLRTRYAEVVGADAGVASSESDSLNSDYTVSFNASAPVGYELTITTSLNGAFTLHDDGTGSATADVSAITGSFTGGSLVSGTLSLSDPGSLSGGGGGNAPFLRTSIARIRGLSNGSPIAHTLRFTWSSSCSSDGGGFFSTGGDECAVRLGNATTYSGEDAGHYPGDGNRNQSLDGHFVTVSIVSLCGNGTLDGSFGEACDDGPNNGLSTSCCTSTCQFRTAGATCRPASDTCDQAETCTGSSATCPADIFKPNGTSCRAAVLECDLPEVCTGSSPTCPPDAKKPAGTACTADSNPCTLDRCDGTSSSCTHPAGNAGALCRAAAGVCDLPETCTGTSTACPPDQKSTALCRPANGACDVAENCNGTGNNCPPDAVAPAGTSCRAPAGVCDAEEFCDGISHDCGPDSAAGSFVVCRPAAGPCDQAENCDGSNVTCPPDAKRPSGAVCRAAAGSCDVAETCDGSSDTCPSDTLRPSGFVCRSAAGFCDLAESCTGSAAACPVNGFKSSGTVCRSSAGVCDVPESCTGSSGNCPADGKSTAVCRSATGACDMADNCDGVGNTCPADGVKPAGTVCRSAAGVCDLPESCDGTNKTCPVDSVAGAFVVCRPSAGVCDPAENCNGSSINCPPNSLASASTVCRSAAGECDLAENCTGSSVNCPADSKKAATTACTSDSNPCTIDQCDGSNSACQHPAGNAGAVCRSSAGVCDVAETCDGTNAACPANAFQPSSTVCRPAAGDCDVAENCTGSTASCPADAFQPNGSACSDGDACTVDSCQNGTCVSVHDVDACLDDFQCYKVKITRGTPPFAPITNVSMSDSIETGTFDMKKVRHLCPPANKNHEGVVDENTHLLSYQIKPSVGQPTHLKHLNITVTNQLGTLHVDTVKAELLLVPTNKDLSSQPPAPDPQDHNVDHYKCYKVKVTRGFPKFPRGVQVTSSDQFTQNSDVIYDLKAVKHLCYPVSVNGSQIKNSGRLLLCYKDKPAAGQPLHLRRTGLYVNNEYGPLRLDTVKEDEFCIPSE